MWAELIASILGMFASARGGNPSAASQMPQLGSSFGSLLSSMKSARNGNLTDRGYPSSRAGY